MGASGTGINGVGLPQTRRPERTTGRQSSPEPCLETCGQEKLFWTWDGAPWFFGNASCTFPPKFRRRFAGSLKSSLGMAFLRPVAQERNDSRSPPAERQTRYEFPRRYLRTRKLFLRPARCPCPIRHRTKISRIEPRFPSTVSKNFSKTLARQ